MTILGVGLEIVDKSQWDRKIQKSKKRNPSIHYSARWACKIAVLQALVFRKVVKA